MDTQEWMCFLLTANWVGPAREAREVSLFDQRVPPETLDPSCE